MSSQPVKIFPRIFSQLGRFFRTGAIAKKLYTQLTSLYAHYSAIKVKYDAQQGLIDGAERKARNANIKTRKSQSRLSALKAELAVKQEQLDALQGMVDRLNQKQMSNMKKLMAAWRNKSLLTCWNAWKSWAGEEKSQKRKMKKVSDDDPQRRRRWLYEYALF